MENIYLGRMKQKMKEIKTKLVDVKRVDAAGEKRHYYLDCRYEGELQYEFEGKTYQVIVQASDPDFMRGRIMLDIYPTVLAYYGREKMPAHVFESVEGAKNAIGELELFTCPTDVREVEQYLGETYEPILHTVMFVGCKTAYEFTYKGETVALEHSETIPFLVREV